jgi:hypothetical protein
MNKALDHHFDTSKNLMRIFYGLIALSLLIVLFILLGFLSTLSGKAAFLCLSLFLFYVVIENLELRLDVLLIDDGTIKSGDLDVVERKIKELLFSKVKVAKISWKECESKEILKSKHRPDILLVVHSFFYKINNSLTFLFDNEMIDYIKNHTGSLGACITDIYKDPCEYLRDIKSILKENIDIPIKKIQVLGLDEEASFIKLDQDKTIQSIKNLGELLSNSGTNLMRIKRKLI